MLGSFSPRRWRFSLQSMLVVIAFAALAITIGKLWNELVPLRAENKRLNEERGTLVIDDPTKVQAIKVPARFAGEDRYTYRIFVPKGISCNAVAQINEIPKECYPVVKYRPKEYSVLAASQGQLFARLDPGEHVLSIRIIKISEDRKDIQLIPGDKDLNIEIRANSPKDRWPSTKPQHYLVNQDGVKRETTSVDKSGNLLLLRYRVESQSEQRANSWLDMPESKRPLDGMMLWLESK